MKYLLVSFVFAAAAAAQITQPGGNASGVAGVASFNTRTGTVSLTQADVSSAAGHNVSASIYNDQANTYTTGLQDFTAASLKIPVAVNYAPTASGLLGYNSTNNTLVFGINGLTGVNIYYTGTQPVSGHCAQFGANAGTLTDAGAACGTGAGGITAPGTTVSGNIVTWNSTTGAAVGAGLTAPASALVGISDAQTLTNKSIAASEINSGVLAAAQHPALTGDVTNTAGSVATTVARINGLALPLSATVVGTNASNQVVASTVQGNGAKVQLSTGTTVTNDCVKFDANGNTVDAGAACGVGGGGGAVGPGTTVSGNIVTWNSTNGTVIGAGITPPVGALVGISDAQTLTNKSIAASEINSGTLAAAQMPALTGDVTTTAGAVATSVVKVNGAVVPANLSCLGTNASSQLVSGTCSGGAGGDTISSPNSSLTVGGTASATTLDVSTTYLNTLYAALATANTYTAGAKQTLQTTTSSAGLRIVPTLHPVSGQVAGDINISSTNILEWYTGSAWDVAAFWNGTAPVNGSCTKWSGTGGQLVSVTCPTGVIVGTTDAQTLTNKSIAASEVNSGVLGTAQIPGLTGDVTSTDGTVATTVVKVNGAVVPASQSCLGTNSSSQLIAGTCTGGTGNTSSTGFQSTGTNAGFLELTQGPTNTLDANAIAFQAPTSVPTSYLLTLPSAAPAAGQMMTFSAPSSGVSTGSWTTPGTGGSTSLAVQQGGTSQGTATTLNCSTNVTCTVASNIVTVTATGGGGGGGSVPNITTSGVHTGIAEFAGFVPTHTLDVVTGAADGTGGNTTLAIAGDANQGSNLLEVNTQYGNIFAVGPYGIGLQGRVQGYGGRLTSGRGVVDINDKVTLTNQTAIIAATNFSIMGATPYTGQYEFSCYANVVTVGTGSLQIKLLYTDSSGAQTQTSGVLSMTTKTAPLSWNTGFYVNGGVLQYQTTGTMTGTYDLHCVVKALQD